MAAANRLWGADRIRGELLKLDIRVSTIQRNVRQACPPKPAGQTWATFLRNHAGEIWVGDVLPVTDLWFRPLPACFIIALGSRRVVHVGVTHHPTDAGVGRVVREATPSTGSCCAAASGIRVLRTPIRASRANSPCERFLGSVRRECLNHLLVLGEHRRALILFVTRAKARHRYPPDAIRSASCQSFPAASSSMPQEQR